MNTYEVTFERNSVCQINLVRADTADRAESYFRSCKPDAQIIAVSVATADSYRPGKPVLVAGLR